MDAFFIGIDVAKDRLDVALRPCGEAFTVARSAEGLDDLVSRLTPLRPQVVAIEATGGYEAVVAAALKSIPGASATPNHYLTRSAWRRH